MTVDIYQPDRRGRPRAWRARPLPPITAYRAGLGLPAIPLSAALTATAGRHVLDTRENIWADGTASLPPGANLHSWSDAPYPQNGRHPEVMWVAPDGSAPATPLPGYEISAAGYSTGAAALEAWKASPAAPGGALQLRRLGGVTFAAIGVGVDASPGPGLYGGRVYDVWFGERTDASGQPMISGTMARRQGARHRLRRPPQRARGRRPRSGRRRRRPPLGGAGADGLLGGRPRMRCPAAPAPICSTAAATTTGSTAGPAPTS